MIGISGRLRVVGLLVAATAAAVGATACGRESENGAGGGAEPTWQLDPTGAAGDVTGRTSEEDLVGRYGRRAVVRGAIPVGEGETQPGTILFPGDSARELAILWRDSTRRDRPQALRVTAPGSRWTIAPGVRIGTRLSELETLNGGGFTLTGFGWDYAGTVMSWDGGRLEEPFGGTSRALVRLAPAPGVATDSAAQTVAGDRLFRSSDPVMRRLDPAVYEMVVIFGDSAR